MDVQVEHMRHRCLFICAMCSASLFGWYNYSLFDPIDNSFFTPYYQNDLLFLFYLGWDTYHMIRTPVLFRSDLMIHHAMALIFAASCLNNNALQMSCYLMLECVSLMNYTLRHHPRALTLYRLFCICIIRMPLTLWFYFCYNATIMYPYWKTTRTHGGYLYLRVLHDIAICFVFYDMFLLWKLSISATRIANKPNKKGVAFISKCLNQ